MPGAKRMSAGYRGKRVTKDRLAGMSSYQKAKSKSNSSVARGTSKKAQSSAARKGAEGPKKRAR